MLEGGTYLTRNLNVLILAASYGDGHLQVARVLQKGLNKKGVKNVRILDLFAEAHPHINEFMRYVYLKSFTVAPSVYGWVYNMSKDMQQERIFAKMLNSFGMQKLRKIMKENWPDVVINTFPAYAMPELRLKFHLSIPIYTVITDFSLHQRWLHSEIDQYFVATEDLKQEIIKRKVPADRIKVKGIPVREAFDEIKGGTGVYEKYGLNKNEKISLVVAGAYGVLRNLKEICQTLIQNGNMQVVLACGKNETLLKDMTSYFAQTPSVKVVGFVEDIHELMAISSCMITKPGGITLSEAIATGVPTFLFRPVPGQEKENADYLSEKGAAVTFYNLEEFQSKVLPILKEDERLFEMKKAILPLQRDKSADMIVQDILNDFTQKVLRIEAVK